MAVLLLIVLISGTFYGYRWLSQRQTRLQATYAGLQADQAEAELALRETDLWTQRKAWIQANEPVLGDEGEAKAQVLAYVLKGARDHKLEILEQSLNDVQHGPAGTRINVAVKVKGPMQALCEWMTELEKPDQFYAVSLFSLKADADEKSMVCTVQLARYFKGGS